MSRLLFLLIYVFMTVLSIVLIRRCSSFTSREGILFCRSLICTVVVTVLYMATVLIRAYDTVTWIYSLYFSSIDVMLYFVMCYLIALSGKTGKGRIFRSIRWIALVFIIADIAVLMTNPLTGAAVSYYRTPGMITDWNFRGRVLYQVHLSICYMMLVIGFAAVLIESLMLPAIYRRFYSRVILSILIVAGINALYLVLMDYVSIDLSVGTYSILAYLTYWNSFVARDRYLLSQLQGIVFEDILQPVFLFGWDDSLVYRNRSADELTGEIPVKCSIREFMRLGGFEDRVKSLDEDTRFYWNSSGYGNASYICDFRTLREETGEVVGRFFIFTSNTLGTDPLTGFQTESYFMAHREELLGRDAHDLLVCVSDLNRLTILNNTVGREGGDRAIGLQASLMRQHLPSSAVFVRLQDAFLCAVVPSSSQDLLGECMSDANADISEEDGFPFRLTFNYAVTQARTLSDVPEAVSKALTILRTRKLLDSGSDRSSVIDSLQQMLMECDTETELHVRRTRELGEKLSFRIGLSGYERDQLSLLCLFHDIGKVGIPGEILNKAAKLTDAEREIMRSHAEKGYRIARATPELNVIASAIRHHHENWDGSGYPDGLSGESIPLLSRIISVVDAYDAMVSDRPYRKAMSHEAAIAELRKHSGHQFDPYIVRCFVSMLDGNEESAGTENEAAVPADEQEITRLVNPVTYSRYTVGEGERITGVDKNFEHLTGYTAYDVRTKGLTQNDLIFEEDREMYWSLVREHALSGSIVYLEHRLKRMDGTGRYVYCTGIIGEGENTLIVSDITDSVSVQLQVGIARNRVMMSLHRLEEANQKDPLTGALNRAAFRKSCKRVFETSPSCLFLMTDVDNFKKLNDTYGHPTGDSVLIAVAEAFRDVLPADAETARMGGDEFCSIIPMKSGILISEIESLCESIRLRVKDRISSDAVSPSISMGCAWSEGRAPEFEELYERADRALYRAKNSGKDRIETEHIS
ncbi:MAG: diguanylate cyclase domain-containing protein [Bullifex sp.]